MAARRLEFNFPFLCRAEDVISLGIVDDGNAFVFAVGI